MNINIWPITLQTVAYREAGLTYAIEQHTHSIDQWYFVLHGQVDVRLDGGNIHLPLGAEESVLIPPGMPRQPTCGHRAPGYLIAMFENRGLDFSGAYNRKLTLPAELRPDLRALVAEIRNPGVLHTNELLHALIIRLLIGLSRHKAEESPMSSLSPLNENGRTAIVQRVERFMRGALGKPLSREDMAAVVNLSEAHLARIFRAATGKTLLQRLTELRMEEAKHYLLESDLPITHISLEVGFNSFSHFTKLFKKEVGVSPSDYRASGGQAYHLNHPPSCSGCISH